MKIKFVITGAFVLGIVVVKAQQHRAPQSPPPTPPPPPATMPMPKMQMDVPVNVADTVAVLKEANDYLLKIAHILNDRDFTLYRKKEAKLVPSGNPFGLLKVRKKYYKIFLK
ncbi:hypothetical protein [Mucilaginibacter xinganensis]|uniref:Uncharacterized protein n=1 Tax=Mucilaginibacter xinganensis TaxID=1234841 RepID=A0A223P309_9SPHI|nr:hypothetical protein [Mucilaginibacter xinganensis]ASU36456.1 hypothetical protein MuYL_4571 [Mucilaginibacter xinganensis]